MHTMGDGTAATAGPLTLQVSDVPAAGSEGPLKLAVLQDGMPVTDFAVTHEKPMHLLLVSGDLSTMLHVHPEPGSDGMWEVPVSFPFGGPWRVVADVALPTEEGNQHYALGVPVEVAGQSPAPFTAPEPSASTSVDGFDVALAGSVSGSEHGMLMATVTKAGKSVELEPWLGADGHLVGFRVEDGAYAHMHPGSHDHGSDTADGSDGHDSDGHGSDDHMSMPGMMHFETEFPGPGRYRMFLQFKVDGTVHTASFTLDAL